MNTESRPGLPEKRRTYSPVDTAEIRSRTVSEIVTTQAALLERAPQKTPLTDVQAVRAVSETYTTRCADIGVLPNLEGLAAALGYSRRGVYDFLERHGNTPTAEFIDRLRTLWAGMRQMAADRGAVDATMSIFVLLNSSLGYSNQHTVEVVQPRNTLDDSDGVSLEERKRRINTFIESLPDPEENYRED